jgi:hypothetical protein
MSCNVAQAVAAFGRYISFKLFDNDKPVNQLTSFKLYSNEQFGKK